MAYRGFKRVLGDTSLERKCLWWFGVALVVLLGLSFYASGRQLRKIIRQRNIELSPQLVGSAWVEPHFKYFLEPPEAPEDLEQLPEAEREQLRSWAKLSEQMLESSRSFGRPFNSYAILPSDPINNPQGLNAPQNSDEANLLRMYATEGAPPVERFDGDVYRYYEPIYAEASCLNCHHVLCGQPGLAEGDLMAVMRIEMEDDLPGQIAKYEALMWTIAVMIGFLSMFLLYFIIRLLIVRPVQHLRDVSNAVREGNTDQRAEIRTGDEFEDLAAAFNRMLRQLLSQQTALQNVNGELDGKIDELAQANLRLFEMNRLKSDFLATMSHELRTPLNSILGFSDVLGSIEALDNKQKRYVGNIQRSGKVLLEMINDILDLAKMESGRMQATPTEFSIQALVGAQCDMARPLSERKNIDLEVACPNGLPPMRQDQPKLQQVINNLLSNAIKFTPEGGRIMVRARREAGGLPTDFEAGSTRGFLAPLPGSSPGDDGDSLILEVEDTGIGISDADQKIIFEKFRQGASAAPRGDAMTREQGGTGLGLSIVRELCRLLGGDVTVRSVSGKGSTFTVRLPWRLPDRTDLDTELNQSVAELTRPAANTLPTVGAS